MPEEINPPTVEKFLESKGCKESTIHNELQAFRQAEDPAAWFKDCQARHGGTTGAKSQNKASESGDTK